MPTNASYIERVVNRRPFGWTYTDPSTVYSFEFEQIDPFYWHDFVSSNYHLAFVAGALYIVAIFGIQKFMENRPPFKLRTPLFLWNLSLGMFSVMGFVRFLPGFLYVLSMPNGFYTSICEKKYTNIPMGFWTLMFVLSKFWELGDTLFIVLRKRPLVMLQWYHHLITMIAVWILAPLTEPCTRWYIVLNFGVHSLMYNYFALKSIGVHIPNSFANVLTSLQLGQMLIGFAVNLLSFLYQHFGYDCARSPVSIKLFGFVYGSFLLLFGKLFYDAVIKKGRRSRIQTQTQKPKKTD